MMKKRRTYTDEFKREAVKLVTEQRYSLAEAARNLGVHANLLRSWKQKIAAEDEQYEAGLTEGERMELASLRAENKRLRMERDILKKATARRRRFHCPCRGLREREALRFEFIEQHCEVWPITRYRLPPVSSLIGRRRSLLV